MEHQIQFYGERGLVNSLFLDLKAAGKLLSFLRMIDFSEREPTHLEVEDDCIVTVIIEAGFGSNRAGFGWPDVLIVIRHPHGGRDVIFLEAKVATYASAAADYTLEEEGFNSSLNGQFTLKYRLVHALGGYQPKELRLMEPDNVARAYGEEAFPRRLSKLDNLRNIIDKYLAGPEPSRYYYVALTTDERNPWPEIKATHRCLLPFICKPLGSDEPPVVKVWDETRNTWDQHQAAYGWVSFNDVEPLVIGQQFYRLARHFLDSKRRQGPQPVPSGVRSIRTRRRWTEFAGTPTMLLRHYLHELIGDATKGPCFTLRAKETSGSDSLLNAQRAVILKLFPPVEPTEFPNDDIYLGVNACYADLDERVRQDLSPRKFRVKNVVFEVMGINEAKWGRPDFQQVVCDILATVTEDA